MDEGLNKWMTDWVDAWVYGWMNETNNVKYILKN